MQKMKCGQFYKIASCLFVVGTIAFVYFNIGSDKDIRVEKGSISTSQVKFMAEYPPKTVVVKEYPPKTVVSTEYLPKTVVGTEYPPKTAVENFVNPTSSYSFVGKQQDDLELAKYIRQHLLHPPSPRPYHLKDPNKLHHSQYGQSSYADETFLHGMKDGFFIEAGAVDGEHFSNSLYFEKVLGWRGLLVEPFPDTFQNLLKKNRKAYSINAALATSTEASEVSFTVTGNLGVLGHLDEGKHEEAKGKKLVNRKKEEPKAIEETIKVKAIPLYSILLALDVTIVDFLSLDIESFEVKVIKTIPWDKVKFRLMCIEVNHIPEGLPHLTEFLTSKGYKYLGLKGIDAWYGWPSLLSQTSKTKKT